MSSQDRRWYIVTLSFSGFDSTCIVPRIWLSEDGCFCKFPPMKENPSQKAMKYEIPKNHWRLYDVVKIFDPVFDNYLIARQKLAKTSEESDLDSPPLEEQGRGKRRKFTNSKYADDSDDDDETYHEDRIVKDHEDHTQKNQKSAKSKRPSSPFNVPSPPFKKRGMNDIEEAADIFENSQLQDEDIAWDIRSSRPQIQDKMVAEDGGKRLPEGAAKILPEDENRKLPEDGRELPQDIGVRPQNHDTNKSEKELLLEILRNQRSLDADVQELKKKEERTLCYVEEIVELLGKTTLKTSNIVLPDDFLRLWPVSTVSDFLSVNKKITEDEKFKEYVQILCGRQGGSNLTTCVNNILERFISLRVGAYYTWHGRNNTIPIKGFEIAKIWKSIACSKHSTESESDIDTTFSNWFRYANSKLKKKQASKEKAETKALEDSKKSRVLAGSRENKDSAHDKENAVSANNKENRALKSIGNKQVG